MRRMTVLTCGIALLVLTAAACGDDETGGVSAAAFQAEVNAVCEERDATAAELFTDFPDEPSDSEIQQLVRDFIPLVRDYRDDVADAGTPEGLEDEYDDYLGLIDELLESFEDAADDPKKARALFEEDDPRMAEAERQLGLDDCADSSAG